MASSVSDHSKRHDKRGKKKQAAEEEATSDVGDVEGHPSPRDHNHAKKSQKSRTPARVTFEFHAPVTISSDFNLGQQFRNNRRRNAPSTIPNSTTRPPSSRKQPESPSESPSDELSESDEDPTSDSDDSATYNSRSRKVAKARLPGKPSEVQGSRQSRRFQADEGYNTGSKASYTSEPSTRSAKSKGKDVLSKASASSARHARLSTSVRPRKRQLHESGGETTEVHSDAESEEDAEGQNSAEEKELEDVEDASDDEFAKLAVQICSNDYSNSLDEMAILDTGTKPDWISATFYDELKSSGIPVEKVKLSAEEQKIKYTDFNNKKFAPTSKVRLIVQSEEFAGPVKLRNLSFFVASKASFSILIGRNTIRKQKIMTRGKPDPDGQGVFVGVHGEITEEEKAAIKKKREDQSRTKEERKKQRETKLQDTLRTNKTKAKSATNDVTAHLATIVSRPRRTRSSQQGTSKATKHPERQSDSSLEGNW